MTLHDLETVPHYVYIYIYVLGVCVARLYKPGNVCTYMYVQSTEIRNGKVK